MDQIDHFTSLQLLCNKLWLFRTNGFLCDTIIVTSDRTLTAHSVVLAAGSSLFFAAVSASSDDETRYRIFIPHLSGNEVETLLFCIYNGRRCESHEKLGNSDDSYLKNLYGQFGVICLKNAGDHDQPISAGLNGLSTIEWIVDGKLCPEILSVKNAEDDMTACVQSCAKSDKDKMEGICSNETEKDFSAVVEEQDQDKDLLLYNPCCQPFTDTLKFVDHKISDATDEAMLAHSCDICEQNFQTDCQFRQHHHNQSSICRSLSPRAFSHSHLQDSWTEHLFEEKSQNVEFLYNNFVLSYGSTKDQNKFHEHRSKDSEYKDSLQSRKSFYNDESHDDAGKDEMACCKSDICNLEISCGETGAFKCKVSSYCYPRKTKAILCEESKAINAKSNDYYVCKECDKTFKQEYMLMKHQTSHGNDACYVCYVCHQGFSQCHYLHRHLRRHTDETKYACNFCGKAFREKYLLRKHCLIHASEKPFSCDICGRKFGQDYYLTKHRKRHSDEHNYSCEYCGRAFKENYQLNKHIKIHLTAKKYSCAKCNRLFRDEKHLQKHILIHKDGSVLSCETCGKVFKGQTLLNAHRRSHRPSKSSVTCKICNLTLTSLRELHRHETAEHRLVTTSTCQCNECGKLFARVTQLRSHMRTHSDERPHICSICQRSFRRHADLRSHLLTHTGQKSNLCSICGKGFLKKSDLKRHFQAHMDERPYVCDTCGKGFKVLSYLKEHIFIHASEKKLRCPDCKKAFISIGNLKNHMKIHSGLKPHKCPICGKEFLRPSNLKSHLKIHVKRPETCSDIYSPLEQILDLENYTLTDVSQMLAG